MKLSVRTVTLHGGPHDGSAALVSDGVAVRGGHVYVLDRDGGESILRHAPAVVRSMTGAEIAEMRRVGEWMDRLIAGGSRGPLVPVAAAWIVNLCAAARNHGPL